MFNMHEAKTHLSRLVEQAMQGKEIILGKAGVPLVKLEPIKFKRAKLRLGVLKGKITIADDFDAPLPEDWIKEFEG